MFDNMSPCSVFLSGVVVGCAISTMQTSERFWSLTGSIAHVVRRHFGFGSSLTSRKKELEEDKLFQLGVMFMWMGYNSNGDMFRHWLRHFTDAISTRTMANNGSNESIAKSYLGIVLSFLLQIRLEGEYFVSDFTGNPICFTMKSYASIISMALPNTSPFKRVMDGMVHDIRAFEEMDDKTQRESKILDRSDEGKTGDCVLDFFPNTTAAFCQVFSSTLGGGTLNEFMDTIVRIFATVSNIPLNLTREEFSDKLTTIVAKEIANKDNAHET